MEAVVLQDTKNFGLLDDPEIGVLTRIGAPASLDAINPRCTGALLRPPMELAHRNLLALSENLDATVAAVFHPTANAQTSSFTLCSGTEVDSLNSTSNDNVELLERHGRGFVVAGVP